MTLWYRLVFALLLGLAAQAVAAESALAYPDKPLRIIVPFPPGGFNDTLGRFVAQHLQETWGQPAVVDNRPGGATVIGTEAVAKAAPDGHTLLVVAFPFAVVPSLYTKLPYDTAKDFAPVIFAGQTPNLLVVNPALPIHSVKDLIATAKATPGKLSYGSTGPGSSNNLSMVLFMQMAGAPMTHVPYKGSAPMVSDLLGKHIDVAFDNTPNVLPHVKSGGLRALGTSGATRSALTPDVPTVAEAGVPGYDVGVWFGLVAPVATPKDVVEKLNAELNRMLALPSMKQRFLEQGVEPVGGPPERFGTHVLTQIDKWAKVVKEAGIKPE
ncbi:MAG TPA: tripartite tricarboxylate transporter substrate binding protein [Xanthobacteraceae bacterium]